MNFLLTYHYVEDPELVKHASWGEDYLLIDGTAPGVEVDVEHVKGLVDQIKTTRKASSVRLTGIFPF